MFNTITQKYLECRNLYPERGPPRSKSQSLLSDHEIMYSFYHKLGLVCDIKKILIERVQSCLILNFFDSGRIGDKTIVANSNLYYVKINYSLRPFQKALTCPNRITNTLFMEEKVYFSSTGSKFRPRSWTPILGIQNSRSYY
jgi:hypothetical protein